MTNADIPKKVVACLEELTRRLHDELGDNLLEIRLFGSYARGEARVDSDLDVLVVVNSLPLPVKERVLEVIADVSLEYDLVIGPVIWDLDRRRQHELHQTLLLKNIQAEGVALWVHP